VIFGRAFIAFDREIDGVAGAAEQAARRWWLTSIATLGGKSTFGGRRDKAQRQQAADRDIELFFVAFYSFLSRSWIDSWLRLPPSR